MWTSLVVLCVLMAAGASSDPGVQLLGADDATSLRVDCCPWTILGCKVDCPSSAEADCETVMADNRLSLLEAAITEAGGCSLMLSEAGIVEGATCADVVTDNAIISALVQGVPDVVFQGDINCNKPDGITPNRAAKRMGVMINEQAPQKRQTY